MALTLGSAPASPGAESGTGIIEGRVLNTGMANTSNGRA